MLFIRYSVSIRRSASLWGQGLEVSLQKDKYEAPKIQTGTD